MVEVVPSNKIEKLVGTTRDRTFHFGRADSIEETVYVLHSQTCVNNNPDLRKCLFSIALDLGICEEDWSGFEDVAVRVKIEDSRLVPVPGTEVESSRRKLTDQELIQKHIDEGTLDKLPPGSYLITEPLRLRDTFHMPSNSSFRGAAEGAVLDVRTGQRNSSGRGTE